jgi:hypothetical protein
MVISTLSSLKKTLGGKQFGLFFMSGAVPDQNSLYYDREALCAAAVAASKVTLISNTNDYSLTAGSYTALKVGAGQVTWTADNTSQLVVPKSIQMPVVAPLNTSNRAAAVQAVHDKYLLLAPTKTVLGTDKNTTSAGALLIGQFLTFGFRTAVNLSKIFNPGMFNADVEVTTNGADWTNLGTMDSTNTTLVASASNIVGIRFKAKAAVSAVSGNFMFFGTEIAAPAAPAITHAVLVNYSALDTTSQLPLVVDTYVDNVNCLAIQFTAGGPLASGVELYASAATVAAGAEIYPITFTLTGNILAGA